MPEDRIQDDEKRPRRARRDDEEEERPRRARREEVEEERPRRARRDDEEEERPRRRSIRRDDDADEGGGMNSLIPYKNPKALIAYYLGVFALIPCLGIPLALGAIILGILGLKYRKTHPTAGGTAHAVVGIVLGSIVLPGNLAAFVLFRTLANI